MIKNQDIIPDHLQSIIGKMQDISVLVLGDIMLDRFIYGVVERISPESPVPVLSIKREKTMLGGAGNALSSICGLRCNGHIVALIGNDPQAGELKATLELLNVSVNHLIVDAARPTTVKSRFLAGHQQLLRADFEQKIPVSPEVEERIIQSITALLPDMQAVLISDYGKGMLNDAILAATIKAAKAKNIPVIVDPKGTEYTRYAGASALTPNKKELSEATGGMPVETDEAVIEAARKLMHDIDAESIIATRSQDGISIVYKDADKAPYHLRTTALEVFDVSGAGDVVIATITAALAAGASLEEAGILANIAGGIAVSKVGTTPIRAQELIDALNDDQTLDHIRPASEKSNAARMLEAPNCSAEEAEEQVARWQARGLKIGFTNGCFDILHTGHVRYLNEARAQCDRLIVGLNTDLSIKALKGPERPIHDEDSRASVLSALGAVDMVVLFGGESLQDDQTANALINRLKPDIYFKGGDYKVEDIPETPSVRQYGGEVKILSAFDGHSTTASLKKMKPDAA